jgi:hypothetical protein
MTTVLAVAVIMFMVAAVAVLVTGRATLRSCCSVADPRRDSRMRGAFTDER